MQKYLYLLSLIFFSSHLVGQNFWNAQKLDRKQLRSNFSEEIIPEKYHTYQLNSENIMSYLSSLPGEKNDKPIDLSHHLIVPLADGELHDFIMWESPIVEAGLQAKYPQIKTYKGYKKNDRSTTIRITMGPSGLSAMVKKSDELTFIDKLESSNTNNYIVYNLSDYDDPLLSHPNLCGLHDHENIADQNKKPRWGLGQRNEMIELRKFRLAMACTGPWGQLRGSKEKALEDMINLVNRSNLIFEAEIAMRMVIIADNERIINIDPLNDPYTNTTRGLEILRQNTRILNQRIGESNYDIGHVLSICNDVGGVAGGLICTENRGAGVTCYNSANLNNGTVLVFTHEVGHQITASHTFNNCVGQDGQLSLANGFEPGSGNTIMAYPGACGSSNLGIPRQSYFHGTNLDQMLFYTNFPNITGYNCAEKVDIGNFLPIIDMPYQSGFTIPKSTPFFLNASATDGNEEDNLTFSWEQFDAQTSRPPGDPLGDCPLFVSLNPSTSTARYFPNQTRIMSGEFFNRLEYLPTYSRNMTFRFIARDDNPLGSSAVWEEIKFRVDGNAGPFEITEPSTPKIWKYSERVEIEWNVANTNNAPVNCKSVDIFLFTGNRIDFDSDEMIILAERIPNNGKASVIMPAISSTRARIVIKASDNIFFTLSNSNSRILESTEPGFFMNVDKVKKETCLPESVTYSFSTIGFSGLTDSISFNVEGLPSNIIANFSQTKVAPGETNTLELNLSDAQGNNEYQFNVISYAEGIDTIVRTLFLTTYGTAVDNIELYSPAPEASGIEPIQVYNWARLSDAIGYELQVSTSPAFDALIIHQTLFDTVFNSSLFLANSTLFFWRVRAFNDCKTGEWTPIQTFHTESFSCFDAQSGPLQINISGTGRPVVEATINVLKDSEVNEISVNNLRGSHQRISDLVVKLMAPSGKEVLLWSKKCPANSSINLNLNDKSTLPLRCPINLGNVHKPEEPLANFKGEKTQGVWVLRVEDTELGQGGRINNFDLEFCTSTSINNPSLLVNNLLIAPANMNSVISKSLLEIGHPTQSAEFLTFILTKTTSNGVITKNNQPLNIGDSFTQNDINSGLISYIHNTALLDADSFDFVVVDGESGWLPIHTFNIEIDNSSSNDDLKVIENKIWIYPNPAQSIINISSLDAQQNISLIKVYNSNGQLIEQINWNNSSGSLDVTSFPRGMVILQLHLGNTIISKRVVLK